MDNRTFDHKVDLTNCDREPIHIPGRIQGHGFLVVADPNDYSIVQISENIDTFIGQTAASLIGKNVNALTQTSPDIPGTPLTEYLNVGKHNQSFDSLNPYRVLLNGHDLNLITHLRDNLIIMEFEPRVSSTDGIIFGRIVGQAVSEIQSSQTLPDLLHNAARHIRQITGYDRVMIYRFSEDWHGQVVAEVKNDDLEPFLGLHYPASDIPRQARDLYKTNLIRIIADVNAPAAPIYPATDHSLDLTYSVLRAVSPIHIEYLQNMGVAASLSISLLYRGELWGLISCHNHTPRFVDYGSRTVCTLIGQLLSAALEYKKDEEDQQRQQQALASEQYLFEKMMKDWDVPAGLFKQKHSLLDLNTATGAALLFENKLLTVGETPSEKEILGIRDWLHQTSSQPVFYTHQLPNVYHPAAAFADKAAGLLAIEIARQMGEYVLWFKPEKVQTVDWAGRPDKAVIVSNDGETSLHPRRSFEKWTEQVRNTAGHWRAFEVSTALKLREDMLHVINRKSNEIRKLNEKLKTAYEELDAFSYTISHDLRTPLSSVKSYAEILLEDYQADLNEDMQDLVHRIIKGTDKMNSLIRNVLHYSRVGRAELNFSFIKMKELLNDIREEILLHEKRTDLYIDIANSPPVFGDNTMITQLFSNLLSNAAKYSRSSKPARVEVSGKIENGEVIYTVKDNGIGIEMKHAGKVFELFRRMDNVKTIEGSGIGLAIAKRIVSNHNGKIWFHSEINKGTAFYVLLPNHENT